MEDPSDEFTALRDVVDIRNGLGLEALRPPLVHQEFSKDTARVCRERLKLNRVRLTVLYSGSLYSGLNFRRIAAFCSMHVTFVNINVRGTCLISDALYPQNIPAIRYIQ